MKFDIVVETKEGLHLMLAEVPDRQHGAIVAEAIYYQFKDAPASSFPVRYVWLREMSDPRTPHLLDAWPEYWKDHDGHDASVKAWRSSPRGVSGDESEPDEKATRETIGGILAKLPERYQPIEFLRNDQGYLLRIDHYMIFRDKPAREAIKRAQDYVDEHERARWELPTGVVYGIFD